MKDEVLVFMMLASIKDESKVVVGELPMVCDFLEVFPDDISDFSPERKVEFAIDLAPGSSHMLMDPYIMFASEFSTLKNKLEEQLKKKFIWHNVSS